MRLKKPKAQLNLQELREEIIALKKEGQIIMSHYKKLDEYYSDWEDRLYKIEKKIQEAEEQYNIPKEEIEEYNALADVLS